MRSARAAYAVGLVSVLILTGCSGSQEPPETTVQPGSPSSGEATDDPTAPVFNPCDDLSAELVGTALGIDVTEETGDADNPRCAFLPVVQDGPTLNVNYLWFEGSFDEAWATMGDLPGDVIDLTIDTADNARLVVNETPEAVVITGFVQTGDLIESVNAIQLAPYDRDTMVRAAAKVLATLSARATSVPDPAVAP